MDFIFKRIYRGKVKAVILDLAGTKVDYGSCAPAGAFVELFQRHNIEISTAQAREPMGMHKKEHIRAIAQMPDVVAQCKEVYGHSLTEDDIDSMYREFIPLQIECLPNYVDLIPGVLEAVEKLRTQDIKIGVTTGYNREMLDIVIDGVKKQEFVPDSSLGASDVAKGRPAPWMLFQSMQNLEVFPPEAVVKIGDTLPDIEAGLNANVWTVGAAKTGNMIGMSEQEIESLSEEDLKKRLEMAYEKMYRAGVHYVIDGFADCMEIIEEINRRLASGERP